MNDLPRGWHDLASGPDSRMWMQESHPRPTHATVGEVVRGIELLHAATNDRVARSPKADSPLAIDDRAVDPYHLSHALTTAIGIATDHLEAFRALLVDGQRTHPWAHHTLLRSAVENACTALWLAGPQDPTERRFRRLRLAAHDAWEAGQARAIHGHAPRSGRTTEQIRNGIKALAPDDRNPLAGQWSYRSVVRAAADYATFEADTLELLWRAESGLAHGRAWASFSMLNREEVATDVENVVQMRMTVSVEDLMPAAAAALHLTRTARRRYQELGDLR